MVYLARRVVNIYKKEFYGIIQDLKVELGEEWNFYHYLVGSGRRNMILDSNEGFDLDFHLMLKNWPEKLSHEGIKLEVMNALDKITPTHLSYSKDSTHVITIKCIEGKILKYSYDIALVYKDNKSQILKNEKEDEKNGPYHFVDIPESSSFFNKFSLIKGQEMWKDLRENYKQKKIKQHQQNKENRQLSFSLLISATNEVLQKKNK